jgi:hypothetical protein
MSAMAEPNVDIVVDGHNIELLLDLWAAALGYRKIEVNDEYGLLLPAKPAHPPVILQRVPEPTTPRPGCIRPSRQGRRGSSERTRDARSTTDRRRTTDRRLIRPRGQPGRQRVLRLPPASHSPGR